MRLTTRDRNEFLKAALRSTDKEISTWLADLVDQLDALPDGKEDAPCLPYRVGARVPPPAVPGANGQPALMPLVG